MTTNCHNASQPSPVELQGVTVRYGRKASPLDGLDLAVAPGEVTVLLGANGAGKSTLFRTLLGLVRPTRGTVRLQGHCPYRDHGRAIERVGFVPDVPDLPRGTTPRRLFRTLASIDGAWDPAESDRLIERFAVPLDRPFQKLSRGEGMKAMLVAALAIGPRVLLLDEPFAGLDPVARDDVLELIVDALARDDDASDVDVEIASPRTVLCATHDLDVATRLADRIAVLDGGRIVRYDPVAAFADGATRPVDLKRAMVAAGANTDVAVAEVVR